VHKRHHDVKRHGRFLSRQAMLAVLLMKEACSLLPQRADIVATFSTGRNALQQLPWPNSRRNACQGAQ
jgi:hypothetical protein